MFLISSLHIMLSTPIFYSFKSLYWIFDYKCAFLQTYWTNYLFLSPFTCDIPTCVAVGLSVWVLQVGIL